ncbi:Aminopeptidase 1 [Spathaspora sp. JA1]|nr:Aminopeptidase 1 [Spathaspora sp. JA1]
MSDQPYYEALPTSLKPTRYQVSIFDIDVTKETFKGKVTIELDVTKSTQELHLNYRDLTITKEGITIEQDDITVDSILEFKSKEYFIVKLNKEVSEGEKLVVSLEYDGIIQTNMAGFYKSGYLEDGVEKFMLSTQFEATDARRAFPCLDEPSLKAKFIVDITLDSQWTCLGNTPVKSSESVTELTKKVVFEETPIMSTYLLAWACGDFEYVESFTDDIYHNDKPLPVRIYTTKGGDYLADAKLASEITPKIVDYFSRIFEIKYPLAKLDLLAVHSFSHNAMENWGLITYRSTALLYSETKSDPSYKQKVAYVIAHELAHQWFGNLVTMKWWDELWLNEGFATWVGFTAVDYLFPEWDIFSGFVSESLQQALNLDGLRNSHPIEVPVIDALDIDQVFDAISYLKGASTILMISNHVGQELFLKGVAKYLNENKYSNATSHDLWSSIGQVCEKPIDQLMNSWIKKVGFPVVNVDVVDNNLVLTQSRFLNSGDLTSEENSTKWWIPLNWAAGSAGENKITIDSFESEKLIIEQFPLIDQYFKLNKDTSGVYRVNYSSTILNKNILPFFHELSPRDKVGLIADSIATAISGNNSTVEFLKLVGSIADKLGDDYVVWLELGKRLDDLATVFSTGDLEPKVERFIKSIYQTKSIELIQELQGGELDNSDFLKVKLRSEILNHAGLLSIPEVEKYAQVLFDNWVKDSTSLHPSLRSFVFTTIAHSSTFSQSQFAAILKQVTHPTSLDSREIALGALGHISKVEFVNELFELLIKPEIIPTMDSHFLGAPLSNNPVTRDLFLEFFWKNYDDKLYKLMSTNMVVLDRCVRLTLRNYQTEEVYNKVVDFFKLRDVHGFERSLKQSLDNIKINTTWFNRDRKEVGEYLQ